MTTQARYAKARGELFDGLTNVLSQMCEDELDRKCDEDIVLLAGQRMQVLLIQIERVLKGDA